MQARDRPRSHAKRHTPKTNEPARVHPFQSVCVKDHVHQGGEILLPVRVCAAGESAREIEARGSVGDFLRERTKHVQIEARWATHDSRDARTPRRMHGLRKHTHTLAQASLGAWGMEVLYGVSERKNWCSSKELA